MDSYPPFYPQSERIAMDSPGRPRRGRRYENRWIQARYLVKFGGLSLRQKQQKGRDQRPFAFLAEAMREAPPIPLPSPISPSSLITIVSSIASHTTLMACPSSAVVIRSLLLPTPYREIDKPGPGSIACDRNGPSCTLLRCRPGTRSRVRLATINRLGHLLLSAERGARPHEPTISCTTCRGTPDQRRPRSFDIRHTRPASATYTKPSAPLARSMTMSLGPLYGGLLFPANPEANVRRPALSMM